MKELQAHAEKNNLSVAQIVMANEVAVSGKSEEEINAFIDKIHTAMANIVLPGLKAPQAMVLLRETGPAALAPPVTARVREAT